MRMQTTIGRNLAAIAFAAGAFAILKIFELPYSGLGAVLFALLSIGTFFGGQRGAVWAVIDLPNLVTDFVYAVILVFLVIASLLSCWHSG